MQKYPDELRADFQQFYTLDTDEFGRSVTWRRAASLAVMLPQGCRVFSAIDPEAEWTTQHWLLSRIEHGISLLLWAKTKDGQKGVNVPKMLSPNPARPRFDKADQAEVAAAFGLSVDGGFNG